MKKHHYLARLEKLAGFLDTLPEEKFDYRYIITQGEPRGNKPTCDTVACALGWTPVVFPKLIEWGEGWFGVGLQRGHVTVYPGTVAQELFNMSGPECCAVFCPDDYYRGAFRVTIPGLPVCNRDATAKQVAARIRHFIKWKKEQK